MVGEVRDLETAEIAVKAALTGHLVLSTLHTNDAPSSINRLTNMGVEPFLVTASINMVVAQRLVRRICENCKEIYNLSPDLMAVLNVQDSKEIKIYKGIGCDRCRMTGYKGRIALYEVMVVSDKMRDMIIEGISSSNMKKLAIDEGMETLRQSGTKKVLEGLTTPEEVLATTVADSV